MTVDGGEHQDIEGVLVGHDCIWDIKGTQLRGSAGTLLSPAQTIVLVVCETCHMPSTVTLSGHWDEIQMGVLTSSPQ